MTESAADIAARHGASARPGLDVQRIPRGVSGLPPLVYDKKRGLVYATKPDLRKLTCVGRKAQALTVGDRTWRSMGAMGRELGVSTAAISKAFKAGKLAELVARHLPKGGA